MDKKIINGKRISQFFLQETKTRVESLVNRGIIPSLTVILVGDDRASKKYVQAKIRCCASLNIKTDQVILPGDVTENYLLKVIEDCNLDPSVHGILVQLPLPSHIKANIITNAIDPKKDVDGLHEENIGKLLKKENGLVPCTPYGVLYMLQYEGITLLGKNVVIVGCSQIVGRPMGIVFLNENATVTYVHSYTSNSSLYTKQADIIIVAVGKENVLTADMVKQDVIVIDVGINHVGDKVVGDVDYEAVYNKAKRITPVPGGVGPMTVAALMANTITAAEKIHNL